MAEPTTEPLSTSLIEIYPPRPENPLAPKRSDMEKCLCCQLYRPRRMMDEDGCGICEECLRP